MSKACPHRTRAELEATVERLQAELAAHLEWKPELERLFDQRGAENERLRKQLTASVGAHEVASRQRDLAVAEIERLKEVINGYEVADAAGGRR